MTNEAIVFTAVLVISISTILLILFAMNNWHNRKNNARKHRNKKSTSVSCLGSGTFSLPSTYLSLSNTPMQPALDSLDISSQHEIIIPPGTPVRLHASGTTNTTMTIEKMFYYNSKQAAAALGYKSNDYFALDRSRYKKGKIMKAEGKARMKAIMEASHVEGCRLMFDKEKIDAIAKKYKIKKEKPMTDNKMTTMIPSPVNSTGKYILKGKKPIEEPDLFKWAEFMEERGNIILKQEDVEVDGKTFWVSTVFLGIDYDFVDYGEPILFETMIWEGKKTEKMIDYQERYPTWEKAEKGHKKAVEYIKKPNLS